MNNSKLTSSGALKILGCAIFDVAIILAFLKTFGLFFIVVPGKSILVLFILLLGLLIFNGAIVFPSMLFKSMGIPYSASIVTLFVFYSVLSNVISILLIPGSTVWYMVWEMILFAVFLIIFSIITAFSRRIVEDTVKVKKEQDDKTSIMLQLLEIEGILNTKENQEAIVPIRNDFKALRERIQASTPFGRISGNSAVSEIENKIVGNLISLREGLQENSTDESLGEIQVLLKNTRRLVINRETLNIK